MSTWMPIVELVAAVLLILSGLFSLVSAVGFLRLQEFFLRMHPPALAYTLGSWCAAVAASLYLSFALDSVVLVPLLVPVFLSVTVPVTTLLLARVSLFRERSRARRSEDASAVANEAIQGAGPGE